MPVALKTFLSHLSSSGIVPEEKLKVVVSKKASFADGEALARDMINSRLLTKYQAEQILGGKGKGLTMGKYQILEKIGAGGMGQVYKAFHSGTERIVAIKVMLEKSKTDLGLIKRFEREVKAAAKLVHANIITVFDADQADGRIFMVMEYIKGDDLEEILRKKGQLSVSEVVDYILQAAKGLKYAHDQGVIHRDIKPGNILVDSSGNVKIVDMGLAKIEMKGPEEELSRLTADLSVMGTIDYMSPEQAESTKDVDSRADIYSLGATLYYILIGEVLYPEKKTIVQKILSHREMPIPSLCMNRSDVPPSLDIIFTKMVAKKVEDRYASMAEVIAELSEIKMSVTGISVGRIALGSKQLKQVSFPETVDFFDDSKTINGRIGNKGTDSHVGKKMLAYKSGILQKIYIPKVLAFTGIIVLVLFSLTLLMKPVAKVKEDVKEQNTEQVKLKQKKEAKAKQIDLMNLNVVKEEQEDLGKGIKLELVLIPAGKFMMGSTASKKGRSSDEKQHEVTLTKPFYMGKYEVTQEQWEAVMGNNPSSKTKSAKLPVTDVSWEDCQKFIKKLNTKTDGGYRLPTEAEWEYACRAGTSTSYSYGDILTHVDANFDGLGIKMVGSYKPNAFGVYDMHGNVWERCEDWYGDYPAVAVTDPKGPATGNKLVYRGGAFYSPGWEVRSSNRGINSPSARDSTVGFRLGRSVDNKIEAVSPEPKVDLVEIMPAARVLVAPFNEAKAKQVQKEVAKILQKEVEEKADLVNGVKYELVLIPNGKFKMGELGEDLGVTLTNPFYIGKYEVTQEQWEAVMGNNPSSRTKGAKLPVTNVSWEDCHEFIKNLNSKTSGGYRLPTEAEWEYACRAGTTTAYSVGNSLTKADANIEGDSIRSVGSYKPNAFGLYDMHGNVYEVCEDWQADYPTGAITDPKGPATGTHRVLRGGSFCFNLLTARSFNREGLTPSDRLNHVGFRLARTP